MTLGPASLTALKATFIPIAELGPSVNNKKQAKHGLTFDSHKLRDLFGL